MNSYMIDSAVYSIVTK